MARTKCSAIKRCKRRPLALAQDKEKDSALVNDSASDSEISDNDNMSQPVNVPVAIINELTCLRDALVSSVSVIDKLLLYFTAPPVSDCKATQTEPLESRYETEDPPPGPSLDYDFIELSGVGPASANDHHISTATERPRVFRHRQTSYPPISAPRFGETELFLTGVSHHTFMREIYDYVSPYFPNVKIRRISHLNARYQSFILTVPSCNVVNILDPNFWPNGTQCRLFRRPRSGRLALPMCFD
jgi:hypothetical protein